MKPEKEKWINDILNSTDGIQRAEPNPFLFTKIQNRLRDEHSIVHVSPQAIWLTIASFALLLLLNWRVINQTALPTRAETTDLTTVVSEMQLYPANNEPYGLWSAQNY